MRNSDTSDEAKWKDCLRCYIDCEYLEQAEKMMKKITWYESITTDSIFWLETLFKGLVSAVLCNDTNIKTRWIEYFEKACEFFSIDKFTIEPEASTPYYSVSPKIILKIPKDLTECFEHTIMPFIDNKLLVISDNESLNQFLNRTRKLAEYLPLWQKEPMTYDKYYELRSSYENEIKELKEKVGLYKQNQTSEKQHAVIDVMM
jgi:hypothetical protein